MIVQSSETIPTDASIEKISVILLRSIEKEESKNKYANVKTVMALLGKGAILVAAILAPKSARILLPLLRDSPDWDEWKKYNVSYLKRTLVNLEKQKQIKIVLKDEQKVLQLTNNGKRKMLKFNLENLDIDKPTRWDGKWRLVMYDIPTENRKLSNLIKSTLSNWGFYQLQKSVYLLPYHCFDQIEFIREFYGLGDKIQYLLVEHIENDIPYKTFFDLN